MLWCGWNLNPATVVISLGKIRRETSSSKSSISPAWYLCFYLTLEWDMFFCYLFNWSSPLVLYFVTLNGKYESLQLYFVSIILLGVKVEREISLKCFGCDVLFSILMSAPFMLTENNALSLFSGTGRTCEKSWLVTSLNLLDLWNLFELSKDAWGIWFWGLNLKTFRKKFYWTELLFSHRKVLELIFYQEKKRALKEILDIRYQYRVFFAKLS